MMKRNDVRDILKKAEMLVNENISLDEKAEVIFKKKRENNEEARALVSEAKKLVFQSKRKFAKERSNPEDTVVDEVHRGENLSSNGHRGSKNNCVVNPSPNQDVELPRGHEKGRKKKKSVAQLKFEEKILMGRIAKSASNLQDHRNVLDTLEREFGSNNPTWMAKFKEVVGYSKIHKNYKKASEQRLATIRGELRHRNGVSKRDHFELSQWASSGRVFSRTSSNKSLNVSVLDCGKILKKIASNEIQAMTPLKLKEEDSPEAPYVCNFKDCRRSFTCASPFVAHIEKHRIQNMTKMSCPFPLCDFFNKREELTAHIRAKHTKELLFRCDHCPTQFHTMAAKAAHEKKHAMPGVWAQCTKQSCMKFYQVAKGHCRACGKK